LVSRDNTFLFRFLSKIPKDSRHDRRLITFLARSELADEKFRHGETKQQLSDVRRRLSDSESQSKISGAQLQDTLNSLTAIRLQHSRTETQLSLAQRALSDLQEFAVDAQKFKEEANVLRAERDRILQALNFVYHTLDSTSADFDSSSVDFFPAVQAFVSTVHSRLPTQHLRAADERDEYFAANLEYAKHLRSVNAENARLTALLSKLSPSTTKHPR
jgi:hypothetical protein